MKKIVLLAFVLVLLWPMTVVIYFSAPVRAEPTIWTVDDDGPADFSSIQEAVNSPLVKDGDTIFVYNGTYQECNIVIDKDNLSLIGENRNVTIIDGGSCYNWLLTITAQNVTVTGFTIQDSHDLFAGISLDHAMKSKISNNILKNHDSGIYAWFSDGNVIENNWVANNKQGITLSKGCDENKIRGNTVTGNTLYAGVALTNGACDNEVENNNIVQNTYGISISQENNSIFGNQIIKNDIGIYEYSGPTRGYRIFHNNFINNTKQIDLRNQSINVWDDGYLSGGNYWSDYNGTDIYSGAYQNQTGSDGIGDKPYVINGNNTDHYPLMGTFSEFPVTWKEETYRVTAVCNSTISAFQFDQANKMKFNVTGEEGIGFCRVTIPNVIIQDLWSSNYTVLVDGKKAITNNWTDTENTYIYFTYPHPEHEIEIVPEFPTWTSILLIIIVLTFATVIYKRNLLKTPIQ